MIGNLLRRRRCSKDKKCILTDIEKYQNPYPWNRNDERWGIVIKSFALNDQLLKEYGFLRGHIGLISGTCFRIYRETDEYYISIAYNLMIPAYKFCVQIIERPLPSVINYLTTSFGYLDELDGMPINCHKHFLEIKTMDGQEVHIK